MFKKLKDAAAFWRILGRYEKIRNEINKEPNMWKYLISKRLWIGMAAIVADVSGVLPTKYALYASVIGGIITKVIDSGILPSDPAK